MKNLFTFLPVFLFSLSTHAAIPGLQGTYARMLASSQLTALNSGFLANTEKSCHTALSSMTDGGEISVFVAFGYMDVSLGQDFPDSNSSIFNNGDTLDLDAEAAFIEILTQSCPSANSRYGRVKSAACGFRRSGSTLSKTISDRFTGNKIRVRIKIASSSYSSDNQSNETTYRNGQQAKSASTRSAFINAFRSSDAVIYMGHARSGGGPDFYPPVMNSNGHVNYPLYRKNRSGLKDVASGVHNGSSTKVLATLACKSTGLFSSTFRKLLPDSVLVTANDLFDYSDILPTGLNLVEAIVSQRCDQNFTGTTESYVGGGKLRVSF